MIIATFINGKQEVMGNYGCS